MRGIFCTVQQDVITISVKPPPSEIKELLKSLEEANEIVLTGLPLDDGVYSFLMACPDSIRPGFQECLQAAILIVEASAIAREHADHIALLLGVVTFDPLNRTLRYRLEDGQAIANFAAEIIEKNMSDTVSIREGIIKVVMDHLQLLGDYNDLYENA